MIKDTLALVLKQKRLGEWNKSLVVVHAIFKDKIHTNKRTYLILS